LRWAGHIRKEEGRSDFKILIGKPTGGLGVGGRTILQWTLIK
jgi:hypothetical protein